MVIVGITDTGGATLTTMLKVLVSLPATFVALTVKLKLPDPVGIPEITPVAEFKLNPPGRLPLSIAQVIGVLPSALSVAL